MTFASRFCDCCCAVFGPTISMVMIAIGIWIFSDTNIQKNCLDVFCYRNLRMMNNSECYTEFCPRPHRVIIHKNNANVTVFKLSVEKDNMCNENCKDEETLAKVMSVALMVIGGICLMFSLCVITCSLICKHNQEQSPSVPVSTVIHPVNNASGEQQYRNIQIVEPDDYNNMRNLRDTSDILCAICIEGFNESITTEVMVTDCKHYYHKKCIYKWLTTKKECPLCKTVIE